jgi:hypothetical protein
MLEFSIWWEMEGYCLSGRVGQYSAFVLLVILVIAQIQTFQKMEGSLVHLAFYLVTELTQNVLKNMAHNLKS